MINQNNLGKHCFIQDVYRLCGEKRGKVFIMNNKFLNTPWEREGSDVDVTNLTNLFKQLHFEVVTKTDTPAKVRLLS